MRYQSQKEFDLISISIYQIINEIKIFDKIINGIPSISWKISSKKIIKNDKKTLLINRLINFSPTLFCNFHPNDRDYAMAEFYSYMAFALSSFPNKTAIPGPYGLAGNQFSLSYQWKKAKENGLNVPSFYIGAYSFCPYTIKNKNIVYSSIYNYYNWKPCQKPLVPYIFCFERPQGYPYLLFTIGDQTTISPLTENYVHLSDCYDLKKYARKISSIFNSSINETLVFINNKKIIFGMTSNYPKRFFENNFHIKMLYHYLKDGPWF